MWGLGMSACEGLAPAQNWGPAVLKLSPGWTQIFLEDCDEEKGFDHV